MGPIVKQCEVGSASKSVAFVKFDFTTDETTAAAAAAAAKNGVTALYADNEKKTGFVLLVNSASRKIVGRLTPADDVATCKAAIDRALGAT